MSIQRTLAGMIEANRISGVSAYGGYQYRDRSHDRPNPDFAKFLTEAQEYRKRQEEKNANSDKK